MFNTHLNFLSSCNTVATSFGRCAALVLMILGLSCRQTEAQQATERQATEHTDTGKAAFYGWSDWSFTEPFPADQLVHSFEEGLQIANSQLDTLLAKAAAMVEAYNVEPELRSLAIAQRFLSYAAYDASHLEQNAKLYLKWGNKKFSAGDAAAYAARVPRQELHEILQILAAVKTSLMDVHRLRRSEPSGQSLVPVRPPRGCNELYFKRGDSAVLPFGFNNVVNTSEIEVLRRWGVDIVDIRYKFSEIFPASQSVVEDSLRKNAGVVAACFEAGSLPNLELNYTIPDWVRRELPEILRAGGHFMPFDIDHPKTRELVSSMISASMSTVPQDSPFLIKIGNEISFPLPVKTSLGDDWESSLPALSNLGKQKFVQYLTARYGGIEMLNDTWHTRHINFHEAAFAPVVFEQSAAFYDACIFNQERVLNFYSWVRSEIKRLRPQALVYVNLSTGKMIQGSMNGRTHLNGSTRKISDSLSGISTEGMAAAMDISGFDTRAMPRPPQNHVHPLYRTEDYAFEWMGVTMIYDFIRSVSRGKLLFENELHALQTIVNRDDRIPPGHLRCVQWLMAAQGVGIYKIWFWGRDGDALDPNYSRAQYCSIAQSPALTNEYLATAWEINDHVSEIGALAHAARPIAMLYSEASAIQDVDYLDCQMATYEALCFLGQGIDFVTEKQVQTGALEQYDMLVVAGNRHISDATIARLEAYAGKGHVVVRVGNPTLDLTPWGEPRVSAPMFGQTIPLSSLEDLQIQFDKVLETSGLVPDVRLFMAGSRVSRGLFYRGFTYGNADYVFIAQLSSSDVPIDLERGGARIYEVYDVLQGTPENITGAVLRPRDIKLWRLMSEDAAK